MGYLVGAFGLVIVLMGFFLIISGRNIIKKAKSTLDWPQVEGKIVDNEIVEGYNNNDKTYSAYIEYDYQVDGEDYTNSEISIAGESSTNNFEYIESICDKYPLDSTQKVYYNPDDPEESYLELSPRGAKVYFLGGGFALLFGAFVFWIFFSMLEGTIIRVT